MGQVNELHDRVEKIIADLEKVVQELEISKNESKQSVQFEQLKAVEDTINRLKKQGIVVPEELLELKLKLTYSYEIYNESVFLLDKLKKRMCELLAVLTKETTGDLGPKGNKNLDDYLLPVIKLMWSGWSHTKAFHQVANDLDVTYNTVSSQCTRTIGLTTNEL